MAQHSERKESPLAPAAAAASSSASASPSLLRTPSGVPAALSPSSWARASVPLYSGLPSYGADFSGSSRFLLGSGLAASQQPAAGAFAQGRFSEPLSLRGQTLFVRAAVLFNLGLWLVRDSSLTSFLLYSVVVNLALYLIVVRGEPFSLALTVENPASATASKSDSSKASATASPLATPLAASPYSVPALVQRQASAVPSAVKPPPVAFAFNKPDLMSAESSNAPGRTPAPTPSPAVNPPVFHEAVDSGKAVARERPAAAAVAALPTIEPSDMPQTPSVEPVITPMPAAAASAATSSSASTVKLPTESTPVVVAGATARHSSADAEMSWTRAVGSSYDVRIGPNYKKYGKKAPSKGALFECVGCDVFSAPDGKIEHIAQHLQLPWLAKQANESSEDILTRTAAPASKPEEALAPPDLLDPVRKAVDSYEVDPAILALDEELGAPTLFIVNFQIPTYEPGYFSTKEDGEGFSILIYYQITAATRAEIRSGKLCGAVQLFKDFVANAHAFEYHSRFKAIPRIVNPGEAKVGMATRQAMKMYNSKPFLTGPHCHAFIRGPGYMEADIDVHRFCLSARKGAYGTLGALQSLIVDIGFVIEAGRDGADEELPEQILGCGRISHLDPMNAKSLAYYIEIGKKERAQRLAK